MKTIAYGTTILLVALSAVSDIAQSEPRDVAQSLEENEKQWSTDFAREDVESVVRHYAEDAVLLLPQTAPIVGRAAIRGVYRQMVADPAFSLRFAPTTVVVSGSGDLGFTEGTYQLTLTSPTTKQVMHIHGNYVTNYRKMTGGCWKALLDVVLEDASSGEAARH